MWRTVKKWIEEHRRAEQLLHTAAITAAVMFLLAGPLWNLYAWLLDLGPGGLGGAAVEDTPIAHSIGEMETLDRFTLYVWGTGEAYFQEPYFFVHGDTYWVIPLDSGEQVAVRYSEYTQRERRDGIYLEIFPVGTWRTWELTSEERAGVEQNAPQLSTTQYYVDMLGNHWDAWTEEEFKARFHTLCLAVGLLVMIVIGVRQENKKQQKVDSTLPRSDLERWVVGSYAIWGQFFAQLGHTKDGKRDVSARRGPIRIGGQPMDDRGQQYTQDVLKDDWDILDKKALLETVEYMSVGPGFQNCDTQASRAWQLCRSMQLLGMCFVAGWCSREEMLRRSCPIGQRMQLHFRSWEELCESFLEGFYRWRYRSFGLEDAKAALQERREIYQELQARPDSPYRLNWYFPLDYDAALRREASFPELEK